MSLFENIKLKFKKKTPVITRMETSGHILKEYRDLAVTGGRSKALGVRDFPIPTGICSNPKLEELEEFIKYDIIGHLVKNPIHHCVFYNKQNNYCFFAGICDKKQEISKTLIEQYKENMKIKINELYGDK